MARGYLFQVETEKENLTYDWSLSPDDVTGDIGGSEIDWSERIDDRKSEVIAYLADRLKKCGANVFETRIDDGESVTNFTTFTVDDSVKTNWFRDRYEKFRDIAANLNYQ